MAEQNEKCNIYKIYMHNDIDFDFGIYDFNVENNDLSEYTSDTIYDYIGVRTGYIIGSYEKIVIYSYADIALNSEAGEHNDIKNTVTATEYDNIFGTDSLLIDPSINIFRLFAKYLDLVTIPDYVVDFASNLECGDFYAFARDNISQITKILSNYTNMHIIMYEYLNTHRRNRYCERVSFCLTSANTIIMRHYCRIYKPRNMIADTYLSDFNIHIPESVKSEPDNTVIFSMTAIEFNQYGVPIHLKKYDIYDNNRYVIVPQIELSANSINALKTNYIGPILDNIISAINHNNDDIIMDMFASN